MDIYQKMTVITAGIGVLIAGGGLVVSIISLIRSNAVKRQQLRLQEKQEELVDIQLRMHKEEVERSPESLRGAEPADIRVCLEGTARNAKFVVRNWGFGAASNVDLKVAPVQGEESPLIDDDYAEKFPIPRLAPGGECSLIAALTFETGATFDVEWSWENEDGTRSKEVSRVSL